MPTGGADGGATTEPSAGARKLAEKLAGSTGAGFTDVASAPSSAVAGSNPARGVGASAATHARARAAALDVGAAGGTPTHVFHGPPPPPRPARRASPAPESCSRPTCRPTWHPTWHRRGSARTTTTGASGTGRRAAPAAARARGADRAASLTTGEKKKSPVCPSYGRGTGAGSESRHPSRPRPGARRSPGARPARPGAGPQRDRRALARGGTSPTTGGDTGLDHRPLKEILQHEDVGRGRRRRRRGFDDDGPVPRLTCAG